MAMKKCPMCGVDIDENVAFCPYCGAKNQTAETKTETVEPQVISANNSTTPEVKNKKHTGAFVGAIICFVIALAFFALYAIQCLDILMGSESEGLNFLVFLLYMLTIGWITLIPTVILIVITGVCSGICFKSTSKAIKVISIIIFVIDMIMAFSILISFAFPSMGVFTPDSLGGSTVAFRMF